MSLSKETDKNIKDLKKKLLQIENLFRMEKLDPPGEPHKSKYAARKLSLTMKANIEKLLDDTIPETKTFLDSCLALVWLYLGMVSLDTNDLLIAEKQLNSCLNIIETDPFNCQFVDVKVNCYNHLGLLWFKRNDIEKSKGYLFTAQNMYHEFKKTNQRPCNLYVKGYRGMEDINKSLQKANTFTINYLSLVYTSSNEPLKGCVYSHINSKKKLQSADFDPIVWASGRTIVSQFYLEKNGFKEARHYLAAATHVLILYRDKINTSKEPVDIKESKMMEFQQQYADVARYWVKYGLILLAKSKQKLLSDGNDEEEYRTLSSILTKLDLSPDNTVSKEDITNLCYPTLELDQYEQQVTDKYVSTFDEAKSVFLNAQTWLQRAQQYYTFDNHIVDYVETIHYHSQLYNYLAMFDDNPERTDKIQKRRITHLEKVRKELNPILHMELCQKIWYELGETYNTVSDIKLKKYLVRKQTPHAIRKITNVIERGIKNFTRFLDSLKLSLTDGLLDDIPVVHEKFAMRAYYYLSLFYSKHLSNDPETEELNSEKSKEYANALITYCKTHKTAEESCRNELITIDEIFTELKKIETVMTPRY